MKTKKPCGNPECSCSTGIHGGMTFGSGTLDPNGFWEKPCRICAKDYDKHSVDNLKIFMDRNPELTVGDIAQNHAWLVAAAWPYSTTKCNP